MKILNILFESSEVQHEKALRVEKENIKSLQKSYDEIQTMLEDLMPKEANKEVVNEPFENTFPVDHRIVKKAS